MGEIKDRRALCHRTPVKQSEILTRTRRPGVSKSQDLHAAGI